MDEETRHPPAVRRPDWAADMGADPRDLADAERLVVPPRFHDDAWRRPVACRYVDPLETVWLATLTRLGLYLRRDPHIFSMTDGTGLLALSTRDDLDADDNLAQMALHELCHWVTNGADSYDQRDWGFPLWDKVDVREFGCLRLQCWLAQRFGMREMFGPTGGFRQYYDQLPDDPLQPIDDSEWEASAVRIATDAVARVQRPPFWGPISAALQATRTMRDLVDGFGDDYVSELPDDPLPLWWQRRHPVDRDPGR
ncbi:MAG: hypothetical protein H6742_00710 [Alphaproteobacteria bacterium]|nr:hypothetical protein [Alphaproteobacteria bacterium]